MMPARVALVIATLLLAACERDSPRAGGGADTVSDTSARPASQPTSAPSQRPVASAAEVAAVPVEGTLALGVQLRVRLGGSDHRLPGREMFRYARAWTLAGIAGRSVTIELLSEDSHVLDPYLLVVGPGAPTPLADDDGGDGCNARLTVVFPGDGAYRVVATTWRERQAGEVTLRTSDRPGPTPDGECNDYPWLEPAGESDVVDVPLRGPIVVGLQLEGTLTTSDRANYEGRHQQGFALPGIAGERVTVTVASDAFSPYLELIGPDLDHTLGGERLVTLTFPKTGTYRVIVSSVRPAQTGRFTLRVNPAAPATPAESRPGQDVTYRLIVPGERVGPVTRQTSEADLERMVGPLVMAREDIALGEGETEPGTILFHEDSLQRLEILWVDPATRRAPREVVVRGRGSASRWRTREGVTLGTSLAELESLNGRPFTLAGMYWDYEGQVSSWNGGRLTEALALETFGLSLSGGRSTELTEQEQIQVGGDRDRSSSLPAMRKHNPRVYEIRIFFRR